MPLASRAGIDTANGLLELAGNQAFVTIGGFPWAVFGVAVHDHGSGPHNSANVNLGSAFVTIGGLPVVFLGLAATCGHLTTGSGNVTVAL